MCVKVYRSFIITHYATHKFSFQNESIQFQEARLVPTVPLHSCSDIVNHEDIVGQIALSERG